MILKVIREKVDDGGRANYKKELEVQKKKKLEVRRMSMALGVNFDEMVYI